MKKKENQEETVTLNINSSNTYLLSRNFKTKWVNYLWQSIVAGIVTVLFLYVFSELVTLVILASVGSTFFNVFALPKIRTARPRNVIGSYIISIIIGLLCFNLTPVVVSGGVAVGAAAFLMVITDTEHPPAAGIALGLSITPAVEHLYAGAIFAIIGALLASLLKQILNPWLKDLT